MRDDDAVMDRAIARVPWWVRLPLVGRIYWAGWDDGLTTAKEAIRDELSKR